MRIADLTLRPLRVPLVEPFVIATARVTQTDAIEVALTLEHEGRRERGLGECATLPPVTRESPEAVREAIVARALVGRDLEPAPHALGPHLDALGPVARAGLETAWLDALARLRDTSLASLLHAGASCTWPMARDHETDITLPIAEPERMGELARTWRARGLRALKIKVGRALEDDLAAIAAIVRAAPDARLRLDANAALTADGALRLLEGARALGGDVELFEQPCLADDLAGMAEVVAKGSVAVVADESCKTLADVARLVDAGAATGVNLKLVKHGGPLAALDVALAARARGLTLMAGAMVETRLGLSAMLSVVAALGGVEHVDLDTALLLAGDPYAGGYDTALPVLRWLEGPGLAVHPIAGSAP